jgi:long-chain acyl-CoA synthetase
VEVSRGRQQVDDAGQDGVLARAVRVDVVAQSDGRKRVRAGVVALAVREPVEPGRAATSSLALGAAALRRERNVVWFPEGRRSPDAELRPFTPGVGTLLDATDVPAVPVYVIGTEKALPVHAFWPRPNERVRVRFGRPATADELAAEGSGPDRARRIADGPRGRVQRLMDAG